jgi:hypothetical protein
MQESIYNVLKGNEWIGTRVRAKTQKRFDLPSDLLDNNNNDNNKNGYDKLVNENMEENFLFKKNLQTRINKTQKKFSDDFEYSIVENNNNNNTRTNIIHNNNNSINNLNKSNTNRNKNFTVNSAFCLGTIALYCPSLDLHYVLFDDERLKPQWLKIERNSVEVLIGPSEDALFNCDFKKKFIDGRVDDNVIVVDNNYVNNNNDLEFVSCCELCKLNSENDNNGNIVNNNTDNNNNDNNNNNNCSSNDIIENNLKETCCKCFKKFHVYCMPVEDTVIDYNKAISLPTTKKNNKNLLIDKNSVTNSTKIKNFQLPSWTCWNCLGFFFFFFFIYIFIIYCFIFFLLLFGLA